MTGRKLYDLTLAEHDYSDWDGPPNRTILVCTHARSGSTLLGEAIYFSGGLGCPLEYFHVGFRPSFGARWNTPTLAQLRDAVWRHRTDPSGVLSVKLMWRDVQDIAMEADADGLRAIAECPPEQVSPAIYRQVASLLGDYFPASRCIHLFRRDRVRQAVSAAIAEQSGEFRKLPHHGGSAMPRPLYDPATIERLIAYADFCHAHWRNLFAHMPDHCLSLTYEDLVRDYTATTKAVLGTLGSASPAPPARLHRQANTLSDQMVLQYLKDKAELERA